jgi:hypothetical protein
VMAAGFRAGGQGDRARQITVAVARW